MAGLPRRPTASTKWLRRWLPRIADDMGRSSRDPVRAGKVPTMRLRCTNDSCTQPVFRSAEHQRCPKCQHVTLILSYL